MQSVLVACAGRQQQSCMPSKPCRRLTCRITWLSFRDRGLCRLHDGTLDSTDTLGIQLRQDSCNVSSLGLPEGDGAYAAAVKTL